MWLWIVLWIVILVWNACYGFLPSKYQTRRWIRGAAIIVAVVILGRGICDEISSFRDRIFAYVSSDGEVLESKNFPWKLTKSKTNDGAIVYAIGGRYGDASEVSVLPDVPNDKYTVERGIDGVQIKFQCLEDEIPKFTIKISK